MIRAYFAKLLDYHDHSIFSDIGQLFLNNGFVIAVSILNGILISRGLGPEMRGEYGLALAIIATIVQFSSLDLQTANVVLASARKDLLPSLIGNSLFIAFLTSLVVTFVAIVSKGFLGNYLPVPWPVLLLALIQIPISLTGSLLKGILIGLCKLKSLNKIEVGLRVLGLASLGLSLFSQVLSTVTAMFISCSVASGMAILFLISALRQSDFKISISLDVYKLALAKSLRVFCHNAVSQFSVYWDLHATKLLIGSAAAGYLSLGLGIQDFIAILPIAIEKVLLTRTSSLNTGLASWNITKKLSFFLAVVGFVTIGGELIALKTLIGLVYGHKFEPATEVSYLLSASGIIQGIANGFLTLLIPLGIPNSLLSIWGVLIALKSISVWFTIEKFGLLAIGWLNILAQSVFCLAVVNYSFKMFARQIRK